MAGNLLFGVDATGLTPRTADEFDNLSAAFQTALNKTLRVVSGGSADCWFDVQYL